jgi:hypothetical protein
LGVPNSKRSFQWEIKEIAVCASLQADSAYHYVLSTTRLIF